MEGIEFSFNDAMDPDILEGYYPACLFADEPSDVIQDGSHHTRPGAQMTDSNKNMPDGGQTKPNDAAQTTGFDKPLENPRDIQLLESLRQYLGYDDAAPNNVPATTQDSSDLTNEAQVIDTTVNAAPQEESGQEVPQVHEQRQDIIDLTNESEMDQAMAGVEAHQSTEQQPRPFFEFNAPFGDDLGDGPWSKREQEDSKDTHYPTLALRPPSVKVTPPPPPSLENPHQRLNLLEEHSAVVHVFPTSLGLVLGFAPVGTDDKPSPLPPNAHTVGVLWPRDEIIRQTGQDLQPKLAGGPYCDLPPRELVRELQARSKRKQQKQKRPYPRQNNEAGPSTFTPLQTMESAGLQETSRPLDLDLPRSSPSPPFNVMSTDLDPSARAHATDHGVPSNLRNADEPDVFEQPFLAPADLTQFASHDDAALFDPAELLEPTTPAPNSFKHFDLHTTDDQASVAQPGPVEDEEQQQETGYAMLSFTDSYYVFKTPNLMLGRDQTFLDRWQAQKKARKLLDKRREKARAKAMKQMAHAQRALVDYANEPGQLEQYGDDVAVYGSSASVDDDDLEGRPERGLLSHYSEHAGPVSYNPPSDDEADLSWRRQRDRIKPTSSSATSIAPRDVFNMSAREAEPYTGSAAGSRDHPEDWAMLPVHTADPKDIKSLSREHLCFSYDSENHRWVVHIVGNKAYVDNVLRYKNETNIPLQNGSEIYVASLRIVFRLPPTFVDDDPAGDAIEDAEDDEDASSTSDRRLSNEVADDLEDEDVEEPEVTAKKPIPKLKLKAPKAPGKGKDASKAPGKGKPKAASKSKTTEPSASNEPDSTKQNDKGKKPAEEAAAGGDEGATEVKPEQTEASRPVILPGSILEGLAPDEMPEKRKGPGRPPKNGFLSKRDERAVMRRKKEYERRQLPVPDINVILAEVREEQRAKDAAAKGNKARPEGATDAVESIEPADPPEDGAAGPAQPRDSQASQSADVGPAGSSGLPRRPLRSPSPMKPQEAFTEEELKKPTLSYFYLLDEILQSIGSADLQTIYDKFQKRWPYFRYTVTTTGWQSSIRHNLSQHSRFKAVGKMGKGMLWAVDQDAPREETGTKKKKTPPPPRQPQMPMANGQMGPGMPQYQHGPPQYPPRYGQQPPFNPGQGQYSSPYGSHPNQYPPHGHPGHGPHHPNMQPMHGPQMGPPVQGSHMQQPPNAIQPSQQPAQPANPVQAITQAIMSYRNVYLSRLAPNSPDMEAEGKKFFDAVNYFSEIFHNSGDGSKHYPGEEALKSEPYLTLKAIFDQHDTKAKSASANGSTHGQGQTENVSKVENGVTAQPNGSLNVPAQPPQQNQQQVPQQVQQHPQPGQQPQRTSYAPSTAAPPANGVSNGVSNGSQGVQPSVASQTAAAVAQTTNGTYGQPIVPVSGEQAKTLTPGPQSAAIAVPPAVTPGAPEKQPSNGPVVQSEQPATAAPMPTMAPQQTNSTAPINAAPAINASPAANVAAPANNGPTNTAQPVNTVPLADSAPSTTTMPPAVTAPSASDAQPADSIDEVSKQASPLESARPTSAGVKRGAEDVEMTDAESEAKRQRTE